MSSAEPSSAIIGMQDSEHRIDEALYVLSRSYGRSFLLLDRFATDALAETIDLLDGPPPASLPLDDRIFRDDPQRAPLLLELSHAIPSHLSLLSATINMAIQQSLRMSGPHPICAWLFSNEPLERIRAGLRQRLNARFPQHKVYFRYFDPRVMTRLAKILEPINRESSPISSSFANLLGPVALWCHLDRQCRLVTHENLAPSSGNHLVELHFDERTVAAIARIEAVNLTVQHLLIRGHIFQQGVDAIIDAYLMEALIRGIKELDDQISYAWRATKHGPTFTQQPKLDEFIQEASSIGIPLGPYLEDRLPSLL